jgi:hypothetical protein
MIIRIAMENCRITSILRNDTGPLLISPFKVLAGIKEESKNAGYDPERIPVKINMPTTPNKKRRSE